MSELEVALDRYTHSRCQLLYHWNHRRKGEEKCCDAVHEQKEVEYYGARSHNDHLPVVRLISILSFLCGCDGGEWWKCRCRSMSSSSKDTVDEDLCFVSKMKCCNKVKKHLAGLVANDTITCRLASENAAPRYTFSNKGSYHSRRISLIVLHTFAKSLIALSISSSHGSRKAYRICIQLVMVIVLHPHNTLLCPLTDLWLSLCVKFVSYINRGLSLDIDPATSLWSTRTRAQANEWDITAEHAFSCLCDELKR